ncbi:hypothetical protein ACFUKV_08390 [Streptomyces paradoxus]
MDDVPKLLEAVSLLVPEEIATEYDITVNDVGSTSPETSGKWPSGC